MRPSPFIDPPRWFADELDGQREIALTRFIEAWGREGTRAYRELFERNAPVVRTLFTLTSDLTNFRAEFFASEPDLLTAARYLGGPPLSADDLATLIGGKVGRRRLDAELEQNVERVLRSAWDPVRFPWLPAGRSPEDHERDAAIAWTAGIWSVEQLRTKRRTESSRRQENAVVEALREAGFDQRPRLPAITSLDELPRGSFVRETSLAGSKCDVPVRLRDGRLLAIECKVSNTALNSVKRLIRETGGKARLWRNAFGLQVITAAVLSGVYKLRNLEDAQDNYEVTILWEHDLAALTTFVTEARPSAAPLTHP
jgi:hypothetical protein